MQTYILKQGSDTRTAGRKCYLTLKTTLENLKGFTIILSIDRTTWKKNLGAPVLPVDSVNQEIKMEFYITAEESAQMSEGLHETCIQVIDAHGNKQTIKGDLLIDVRRAEYDD